VISSGGQTVFASSVASSGADAAIPSARSAVGDLQSGFGSAANGAASLSASTGGSSATPASGAGSTALGMAVLGLGFMGLLGTSLVAVAQRRRVHSEARSGASQHDAQSGSR